MNCLIKKKCAVGNMIIIMIGMFLMLVVFYFGILLSANINIAVKKTRIEREFIMKMESQGYLTSSAMTKLIDELTGIGVSDIDLTGTTLSPVGYGNEIVLCVKGMIAINIVTGADINDWKFLKGGGKVNFSIYQTSTAKY